MLLTVSQSIGDFFLRVFGDPYVTGFIVSMLPIVELRGGLPLIYFWLDPAGSLANLPLSFLVAFLGSSAVCPILLALLIPLLNWMKKTKLFKGLALKIENHFAKKSQKFNDKCEGKGDKVSSKNVQTDGTYLMEDTIDSNGNVVTSVEDETELALKRKKKIESAKYWGLFVFTAIPLPLTGVWSASAVASILGLDFKKSLFFIILGNLVAAIAISLICVITGSFL